MLGFSKISELSQRFEEALTRRRDKVILANQDLTDALFVTVDTLSRLVDALSQLPREPIDIESVLDRLKLAQVYVEAPVAREEPAPAIAAPPAPVPMTGSPASVSPLRVRRPRNRDTGGSGAARVDLVSPDERRRPPSAGIGAAGAAQRARILLPPDGRGPACRGPGRPRPGGVLPGVCPEARPFVEEGKSAFQEVGTQRSELKRRESVVATALSQNLEELRSEVMVLRMVPLSPLFDSFHPMAGALARELGKDVEVLVRGGKTEIDRKVAEALAEPLTHILRNAVDHGIEPPRSGSGQGSRGKGGS